MVTQDLITYLETYYPDKIPQGELTSYQLAFIQGQQSVILRLKQYFEEEE